MSAADLKPLAHAALAPGRCALRTAGGAETLTYTELDQRTDHGARRLRELLATCPDTGENTGVGAPLVAFCLARGVAPVAAMVSILKAGGAYVPLDPAYPAERLARTLADSRAPLLVTDEPARWRDLQVRGEAPAAVRAVDVHDLWPADASDRPRTHTFVNAGADPLAYVIYTSGSTGRPKGVAMPHAPLANLLAWHARALPLAPGARVLQFAPLAFDVSFQEIFSTLGAGGTLVLVNEAQRRDPRGLLRLLAEENVSRLFVPPVMLAALAEAAGAFKDDELPRDLREIITAGEALRVTPAVARLFSRLENCALHNHYGPTETHVVTAHTLTGPPDAWPALPPIGKPIDGAEVFLFDELLRPVPAGEPGHLHLGGKCLARGYLHDPALSARKFITHPVSGKRMYATGDLARELPEGGLQFLGRADDQVKIRGFRVELGEIEVALAGHPAVAGAAAAVADGTALVAGFVPRAGSPVPTAAALRAWLRERLPDHAVPARLAALEQLPLTPSGKVDRRAVAALVANVPAEPAPVAAAPARAESTEAVIARAWREVLPMRPEVGWDDNFFEIGGDSLLAVRAHEAICRALGVDFPIAEFFDRPTVRALAGRLTPLLSSRAKPRTESARWPKANLPASPAPSAAGRSLGFARDDKAGKEADAIAIIGLAGRFPGAADVAQFWANLKAGVESITRFTDAELEMAPPADAEPDRLVRARGILEDPDRFDAAFFSVPPREAELMDPQARVFLEICWEAMEHAGHGDPARESGRVGVFAGASLGTYFLNNLCANREFVTNLVAGYQQSGRADFLGNDKDFLATRVAHKLGLRGPAMTIGTACSTSLVAVAQACEALRSGGADLALAGGVSITFPQRRAYVHEPGAMASPDGRCRAFDADAQGTVFSSGAGVVVLRRLADAVADGDTVYAVVRGWALNNDGAEKASYSAPSAAGQAEAIRLAQERAGVAPASVSFVEAHGTGTPLGDPIEVAGLTEAFRAGGATANNFCALGAVKTNVGHLESASGVAALIKTTLALHHRLIPPTLHFRRGNPQIDWARSPFYVPAQALPWPEGPTPRRAGVSSFGVGGTNAHAVLEEMRSAECGVRNEENAPPAPSVIPHSALRIPHLLVLSAKTPAALEAATRRLAAGLRAEDAPELADAAWTLQAGRRAFAHRRALVCGDAGEAAGLLEDVDPKRVWTQRADALAPGVVFLFPGQGAQQVGMGAELYGSEPVFRETFDRCAELLRPHLDGEDLRAAVYPAAGYDEEAAAERLRQTRLAQPALFAFGYSLARLWMSWGVRPAALVGHSVGEYVAAALAGVFSLGDALGLVARRARLVQAMPTGAMLAVRLPEGELAGHLRELGEGAPEIAAVNAPGLCVAAGPDEAVERLEKRLEAAGAVSRRLCTSHAFHSAMMDPVVGPFAEAVGKISRRAPGIPIFSTTTGRLLSEAEAADPGYWAAHLRRPVRFADALGAAAATGPGEGRRVLLEIGPGAALTALARQQPAAREALAVASLAEGREENAGLLGALGRLWLAGVAPDWAGLHARHGKRRRVALPTYPFERQRFWIEAPKVLAAAAPAADGAPMASVSTAEVSVSPMTATPAPVPVSTPPPDRRPALAQRIRAVLQKLSGQEIAEADSEASFLELGLDSLLLTQVAGALRKEFGVKITFRQLLEDCPSVAALAGHLDTQLPPEPVAAGAGAGDLKLEIGDLKARGSRAEVSGVAGDFKSQISNLKFSAPAAALVSAPAGTLEAVVQEQLRLMARQLELLRGGGATPGGTRSVGSTVEALSLPNPGPDGAGPSRQTKPDTLQAFGPYRPPVVRGAAAAAGGALDATQQGHLDALIARYTARTPKSKASTQANRRHFADPRSVSGFRPGWKEAVYPLVVERSAGARMWDVDGNEYVDLTMGFGTNLLGHAPGFITAAIEDQLKRGMEVGPQSPIAGEVARLVCELTGAERAAFTNTGSEAVLAAVRLARTVTGRTRIATCGGFHGINDEVLVRAGRDGGGMPVAPGIPEHIVKDVLVVDYGTPEGLEMIRRHAHELAAVLVEPVQSRRPDLQPREWLHALREITREAECALIFDEVITGFRCHPGGAAAFFGVEPDLSTWGKIMGGGLPIGAVTGKAQFMDALDGGMWQYGDASFPEVGVTFFAGTYIRHPLAMAASRAILTHLQNAGPALQAGLNARTAAMVGELNAWFRETGTPLQLENFASLFYPHFGEEAKYGSLLFFHLRERGIHLWEGRPCFLSTAHTDADVAQIIAAFKDSVRALQAGGLLPGKSVEPEVGTQLRGVPDVSVVASRPELEEIQGRPGGASLPAKVGARAVDFSLYYFGHYPAEFREDKYRLVLEGARFADRHGFKAVWLPERHFHAVGGFSPNPSLLAAALARETSRLQLRGGSVVLPLHHPVRVAEEWALVDNLSNGRAGISIASGWHPNDFVFDPTRFERRREICLEDLATIQKLWRGETLPLRNGTGGETPVRLFPQPVQAELPVWLTCIGEESFVRAGELGVGVLGYLMNQTLDEVAAKIAIYRESLQRHGHAPEKGHVTILLHTFVGEDLARTRETARGPLRDYLRGFLDNSQKRLESERGGPVDIAAEDVDYLLDKAFDDYAGGKALIGTPETCAAVVERLAAMGVDEVGCFVDFGVNADAVLASLPALAALRERFQECGRRKAEGGKAAAEKTETSLPLTDSQRGLFVLAQADGTAVRAYQECVTLALDGPLDAETLGRSLQAVVDRHEALRTTFQADGEAQVVHPRLALALPLHEVSDAAALARVYRECEAEAFDLIKGPLFRARLIRLAAERHQLVLTFHHLLGNGPSYWALFEELCAAYPHASFADAGRPAQLSDFVGHRNAPASEDSARFWREQFRAAPPALELPADHPRPAQMTHRGLRGALTVDAALTTALRRVAAARKGTLFTLLLSAFQTLLHRLSGQEDVVVGVPFEGQAREVLAGGGRLFANTTEVLPLRSRVGAATRFAERLAANKTLVLAAAEHRDWFFGNLTRELRLPREGGRAALFRVVFNYESGKFERRDVGGTGLNIELLSDDGVPYRGPRDAANFELYLNVAEKNGALHCECDGQTDLFAPETLRRWLGSYRALLEGIAADPEANVWTLPLLDTAERQRVLVEWNATDAPEFPRDRCLHELIVEQAARTPDAVAVIFEDRTLTYRQLDRKSNKLARRLRALGAGPDTLVGVCTERSLEMVIALLGVLKAGAGYLPLEPEYPAERLHFLLADAQAPVLLTQERLLEKIGSGTGQPATRHPPPATLCLDRDWPGIAEESAEPLTGTGVGVKNLAFVIYTSGSTGRPKGAMNPHRAVVSRLCWTQRTCPLAGGDRVLLKSPFSFDFSVSEIFWPLMVGATVVVAKPGGQRDSDYLAETIARQEICHVQFVPAMLAAFVDERGLETRCRSLRHVICGGDVLPPELVARFFARLPDCRLVNVYGPTEVALYATAWECRPGEREIPIGRLLADASAYVLDPRGQPLPVGVPGELFIGGHGVGLGYWQRPELTAERFLPDPFSDEPGAKIYKTGDLARWREDGALMFDGRLDHQVKLRGFRIELGEIEAAINAHPEVRESVVVAREDQPGDRRLVAYLVRHTGVIGTNGYSLAGPLRESLRGRLPDYMVPAAFVELPALPLSPNGKVDRRALPAPDWSASGTVESESFAAPQTPLERELAALWGGVLGANRVGAKENFFELGGDSLLGLRVVNQLREKMGEHISLIVVFEAPTVENMAALLEKNYPEGVARMLGTATKSAAPQPATSNQQPATSNRITAGDADTLRRIVGRAGPLPAPDLAAPRLAPAVFLLSPMRSGSTLTRIMLAGHPDLFAPPELQLLQFATLAEREEVFTGYDRYMLEGPLRALMEIRGCDLETARALVADFENRGWTPRDFYKLLQEGVAPRRLVDKTPDYAMDAEVLHRAETLFDGALYIHLARHPLGMIRSYEKGRLLLESPYRGQHEFDARQMAELTWLVSHQNILSFLETVPAERQRRIRFEDLVRDPEPVMRGLGEFLGVGFHPGMLQPYAENDGKGRMTDGVHPLSPQVGDNKFHEHGAINPATAEKWAEDYRENFLGEPTWEMAARFGYENPFASRPAPPAAASASPTPGRITAVDRESRRARRPVA